MRVAVAVLVVALIGGVGLALAVGGGNGGNDDDAAFVDDGTGSCTTDARMDTYSEGEAVHVDHPDYRGPLRNPPTYQVNPPSGGDHLSNSVGPGVFRGDNVPPDGVLVHTLEHGYVILWYDPDAPEAEVRDLEAVQREYRRDVLVVERADMPTRIAATAWGHRLLCDAANPGRLAEFVEQRRNQAPERIPH
jgi:hypothetical protein